MKKYFFLTIFFLISNHIFACESSFNNNINDAMKTWLGDNSEFSKAYKTGKCALDTALNKLPVSQRKVIANLIAKSYNFIEIESNKKELLTYNY
jgi:hypothetical protein